MLRPKEDLESQSVRMMKGPSLDLNGLPSNGRSTLSTPNHPHMVYVRSSFPCELGPDFLYVGILSYAGIPTHATEGVNCKISMNGTNSVNCTDRHKQPFTAEVYRPYLESQRDFISK